MKIYGTMSNQELTEVYKKISARQSEVANIMIADGQGRLRLSDMRSDAEVHPLAAEFVTLSDEARGIWHEAEARYGPGLIMVDHLTTALGPNYKRIKEKVNV